jgi:hypothetical protein
MPGLPWDLARYYPTNAEGYQWDVPRDPEIARGKSSETNLRVSASRQLEVRYRLTITTVSA